jgi:glycosyltransferase involved in cell wall biosynthesis
MREKMGAAARERAESFSWAACVQAHVDLYEELLEQHR